MPSSPNKPINLEWVVSDGPEWNTEPTQNTDEGPTEEQILKDLIWRGLSVGVASIIAVSSVGQPASISQEIQLQLDKQKQQDEEHTRIEGSQPPEQSDITPYSPLSAKSELDRRDIKFTMGRLLEQNARERKAYMIDLSSQNPEFAALQNFPNHLDPETQMFVLSPFITSLNPGNMDFHTNPDFPEVAHAGFNTESGLYVTGLRIPTRFMADPSMAKSMAAIMQDVMIVPKGYQKATNILSALSFGDKQVVNTLEEKSIYAGFAFSWNDNAVKQIILHNNTWNSPAAPFPEFIYWNEDQGAPDELLQAVASPELSEQPHEMSFTRVEKIVNKGKINWILHNDQTGNSLKLWEDNINKRMRDTLMGSVGKGGTISWQASDYLAYIDPVPMDGAVTKDKDNTLIKDIKTKVAEVKLTPILNKGQASFTLNTDSSNESRTIVGSIHN